jgi:phage terminase large subunit-like protein
LIDRPGGKPSVSSSWPPRWLTPVPPADVLRGDGPLYADFIEALCRATEDSIAAKTGDLLQLRFWQKELLGHLLARRIDGRFRHRTALIGVARKNTKSTIGAGIALAGLVLGPKGGKVYSCAADKDQGRIVHGTAKRMVELEPELSKILKLYRDAIEFPVTGSVYRVISAEAFTKEGLNPTLVLFDEVHAQPNRELWDVMALAQGAREEPLMIGITTAGVRVDATGQESLCYGLYQYGCKVATREVEDPSFFMAWWEPRNPAADHRLESTQRQGNPGFDDLVSKESFLSDVKRTPEAEFRAKRCNQWVATKQAWLPTGRWEACAKLRKIPKGTEVVLGFDGSFSNDSTALVVVEIGTVPHIDVAGCWERPPAADDSWRVRIVDVEDAIRAACERWQVREIVCDPHRWAKTYQTLEDEGLPVVEFPQSPERMVPATQQFYEAVLNKQLTHSGDPRLARHVANCIVRVDQRGARVAKETKTSMRKIDLAVAALMAHKRAVHLFSTPPNRWTVL